jgi:hypothetical protein
MAAIRVMIGVMPALLRSLVEGILDENPQFEVMRTPGNGGRGLGTGESFDVLVVSEGALAQILPRPETLGDNHELGIVAIAADGLDATVVRVNAHRRKLDDGTRQSLSQAILASAGVAQGSL